MIDKNFNPRRGLHKFRDIPFELRMMACFWHLHLGGPLNQHQASYSLSYLSFRKFFLEKFLVWMAEMKDNIFIFAGSLRTSIMLRDCAMLAGIQVPLDRLTACTWAGISAGTCSMFNA
jgi:hypothetical protein